MKSDVPYFYTLQPMDSLSVDDIGNTVIKANNDDGDIWILVSRTAYGVTRMLEYGPYCNGNQPTFCSCTFDQFDYNENRIQKKMDKFLNNASRRITQAEIVEYDDIRSYLIDMTRYLNQ